MDNSDEIVDQTICVYNKAFEKYDFLRKQLSTVDLEIQDIEHLIEFNSFNVVQGYKYSKLIKESRSRRRLLKREFEILQPLICLLEKNRNALKKIEMHSKKSEANFGKNS